MMRSTLIISSCLLLVACNPVKTVKEALSPLTPYERYIRNLEHANLHDRPMVTQWLEAGQRAMRDSVFAVLPISETGHFLSHRPEARTFRFDVKDGQVVNVNGATTATGNAKVFLDLFIRENDEWKHKASSDSSLMLSYEFNRNATCLLRMQPELLINAYYTISITVTPVLINPVSRASNKSIQSFYGDSRDGGKRTHEGVDIFAKKGTPVVAPTDGLVSRVGYSRLGGKVVWMYDRKRQHSYYFAHLDSQYVSPGAIVKQGDTLGVVGNTGNARFTPPHLHFGIYQSRSKDPLHYIRTLETIVELSPIDTTLRTHVFRVATAKEKMKTGPGAKYHDAVVLEKDTYVRVVGQSRDWYRISLPDHREGYIPRKSVSPALGGKKHRLDKQKELFLEAGTPSVVMNFIAENTTVEVLARFGALTYIKCPDGVEGWMAL